MTKHRASTNRPQSATTIVTTSTAEVLDMVDVLLGMTASNAWTIVDALRATDNQGIHAGSHRIADRLRDALMERPLEAVPYVG